MSSVSCEVLCVLMCIGNAIATSFSEIFDFLDPSFFQGDQSTREQGYSIFFVDAQTEEQLQVGEQLDVCSRPLLCRPQLMPFGRRYPHLSLRKARSKNSLKFRTTKSRRFSDHRESRWQGSRSDREPD